MLSHFGKYVVRTPLFSYKELITGTDGEIQSILAQRINDAVFLEAIYWASPSLYDLVLKLKAGVLKEEKRDRVLNALTKYLIRASSRCTPYGIFAGCSIGKVNELKTAVSDVKESDYRRVVRIDMGFLADLVTHLNQDEFIYPLLNYYPNSSLYGIGNDYRYIECELDEGQRSYQLSAVENTALLKEILEAAQSGITREKIFLLTGAETTAEEQSDFFDMLIQSQLLVSELEIAVTGENQLGSLKKALSSINSASKRIDGYLSLFDLLESIIKSFNNSSLGHLPMNDILKLKIRLKEMEIGTTDDIFFQADLYRPIESLPVTTATVKQVNEAVEVLSRFSPSTTMLEKELTKFKRTFIEKYETAEIPLSEVLDVEFGIGFPVMDRIGNIENQHFTDKLFQEDQEELLQGEKWHEFLHAKCESLMYGAQDVLVLTDGDLEAFRPKMDQFPATISVLLSILPDGQLMIKNAGGPSANNLLGRFAYLHDDLKQVCDDINVLEQNHHPDAVIAEVVYLPEGRAGNVVRRASGHRYEIPYLSASVSAVEHQIGIEDLVLSIYNDELILTSKKLNCRVIPRLSTAHNYVQSTLATYRFLGAMQHQHKMSSWFNWGHWSSGKKRLPRVVYKQVILEPAKWFFKPEDFLPVLNVMDTRTALIDFLKHWRIPRYVAIVSGDNELFLDTHVLDYQQILIEEFRKKKTLNLQEWPYFDETLRHEYTNQVILPLFRKEKTLPERRFRHPDKHDKSVTVQRLFPPGTEWIYYKLYCGAYLSDKILHVVINELATRLVEEGVVDKFFFIRYTDPHYHIRVRLQVKGGSEAYGIVLASFATALESFVINREVWKVQLDTYSREIERYGSAYMELSEWIFFHDSRCCLDVIADDEQERQLGAIKNIDSWLELFELTLKEKIDFVSGVVSGFRTEFGGAVQHEMDVQYREIKDEVKTVLQGDFRNATFEERNDSIRKTLDNFETSVQEIRLNLGSYIHMSLNRWFKTDQRLYEFAAYVYIEKHYIQQLKTGNYIV